MKNKRFDFRAFLKEWGVFTLIISAILLTRWLLWAPVKVDGHSMDPTLANGEYLMVLKHQSIDRFDIVVASEKDDDGKKKEVVKRVIGLPGDSIQYENDTLYINGKKTDEPYLAEYIKKFQKDKLQSTYVGKDYTDNGTFFRKLASQAQAFTVDKEGSPVFTIKLLDNEYLLLGDDRIVSKDSRQVGAFKSSQIQGEAKFRIWPILPFKTY